MRKCHRTILDSLQAIEEKQEDGVDTPETTASVEASKSEENGDQDSKNDKNEGDSEKEKDKEPSNEVQVTYAKVRKDMNYSI